MQLLRPPRARHSPGLTSQPTIENTFSKVVKIKGQEYQLDIHDTAGQDEFSILGSKQAVGLHGWILVYSISSRQSFDMISIIRDKVLDYTGGTQGFTGRALMQRG